MLRHDYLVADLIRVHRDGLPARPVLERPVILETRRDEYGNPRITVHNGGFGPDLYTNSCKPVRLTVLSGSQPFASHYNLNKDVRHENAMLMPCPECLDKSENVRFFFTYLRALMVAAAHHGPMSYLLDSMSAETADAARPTTTPTGLLELRRKLEIPQEIGGLPPMHPDAIDPKRVLGTWWEDTFTTWRARLEGLLTAVRKEEPTTGPTQLVAPLYGVDKPGPDREQGALWPWASGELAEYLKAAPIAGYVPWRGGKSPGPVFVLPAAVDLAGLDHQDPRWASLGNPDDIDDLGHLLGAVATLTEQQELTRDTVAALVAALHKPADA